MVVGGHGWPWVAVGGRRWPWMAMDGRRWPAMAGDGRRWPAMAGGRKPVVASGIWDRRSRGCLAGTPCLQIVPAVWRDRVRVRVRVPAFTCDMSRPSKAGHLVPVALPRMGVSSDASARQRRPAPDSQRQTASASPGRADTGKDDPANGRGFDPDTQIVCMHPRLNVQAYSLKEKDDFGEFRLGRDLNGI